MSKTKLALLSLVFTAVALAQQPTCQTGYVTQGTDSFFCDILAPGGIIPVILPPGEVIFQVFVTTTDRNAEGYKVTVVHDGVTDVLRVIKNPNYPETLASFVIANPSPVITSITVREMILKPEPRD